MIKMIYEYKRSLQDARRMYKVYDHDDLTLQDESDKKIIASMIRDLEFIIQWLETGRNPDLRRGIDKAGVYSTDPQILDKIQIERFEMVDREHDSEITELIDSYLEELTDREIEVFVMIRAEGLSYGNTAKLLGIKKTTVQNHLEKAERKIKKLKNDNSLSRVV